MLKYGITVFIVTFLQKMPVAPFSCRSLTNRQTDQLSNTNSQDSGTEKQYLIHKIYFTTYEIRTKQIIVIYTYNTIHRLMRMQVKHLQRGSTLPFE